MATAHNQKIGVATATIISMNAMIGSGIFSAPATMAAHVGPAGILAYVLVVISVWFIALSLARLAQLFPEDGAFYTYAKQWSGHYGGLIASGAYLIGLIIAMGLLSQMAGNYLQSFLPEYSAQTLGLITLSSLVILNMFGVVMSEMGQHILIVLTVFPLIATTIMCLTKMNLAYLTPFAPYGFTNVLKATRIVIFSFFGFECAASLFNIVKDPARNVPRALTYSIGLVGAIYILFISSIILSTPLVLFSDPFVKIPEILKVTFPNSQWVITTISVSILSAILGTVHSMIWSSSHLAAQIAKKINPASALNNRLAVLIIGASIIVAYTTIKNPDLFFYLTAFFIVFAYIMSMITLITIKEEWRSGNNIKTVLGLLTAIIIFAFALEGLVQEIARLSA